MNNPKEKLPTNAWRALEPFLSKNGVLFERVDSDENLIEFTSTKYSFYFKIQSYQYINNSHQFKITFTPANADRVAPDIRNIKSVDLEKFFGFWIKYLDEFENVKTVFDDPIQAAYEKEFFEGLNFHESEDPERLPFTFNQALILDDYLTAYLKKLEEHSFESIQKDVDEIKGEIDLLRKNLLLKPKDWGGKKLAKIWAKTIKTFGVTVAKEFLIFKAIEAINNGFQNYQNVIEFFTR